MYWESIYCTSIDPALVSSMLSLCKREKSNGIALFKNELGSGASFASRRLLGSILGTELVVCKRNEANLNCLHRHSSTYCENAKV